MSDGPRAYMFNAAMWCPGCIAKQVAHPAELGTGVSTETILDRVARERGIDRSEEEQPFDSEVFPAPVYDGLNRSERCMGCETWLVELDPAEASVLSLGEGQGEVVRWRDDYVWVETVEQPEVPGEPYVVVGRTWSTDDDAWGPLEGREYDPEVEVALEPVSDDRREQLRMPSREHLSEDWHMRNQLPLPGLALAELDTARYVYRLDPEEYPVNEDGGPLEGDQAQYRLYAIGERQDDGSVRYYDREHDTEWTYTSRWGSTHEQIRAEVAEWAGGLFGLPMVPSHTGGSWELTVGSESRVGGRPGTAHGESSGMGVPGLAGGGAMYQQGAARLLAAAQETGLCQSQFVDFAAGMEGNRWGVGLVSTLREAGTLMRAVEGDYRQLAAQVQREGENGAAAHDSVPYAPDPEQLGV